MANDLPVIILPGNMCDERAYTPQHTAFAGRQIIFADLTSDTSIEGMAKTVLSAAPDRFLVFGHSMGGITALELIRQAPERVAGAVLVATNPMAENDERRANRLALVAELDGRPLREIMAERLVPHYFIDDQHHLTDLVIDMALKLGPDVFRSQARALMDRADSRPSLEHFELPVLLVGGQKDKLVPPAWVCDMERSIPNARRQIIEQSAHFPGLENPKQTNNFITDWLEEHNL